MWNKYLASLFVLLIYCQLTNAQEALKAPVVKIHAFLPGALDEIGAGIITGERDEVLYILTALHVIEPGLEGGTIEVILRGRAAVTAEMIKSNRSYDLALIGIRKPMGFSSLNSFLPAADLPMRESYVTLVGHPQGSEWDINSRAQLKATQLDLSNDFFTLYPEQVKNGHSGGPVLNQDKELIGMVLETSGVRARCLNVAFLMRACNSWNVPIDYMTGIIDEGPRINSDPNDFRYNLLVRRGNQAFEAEQWQTAKDAFSDANNLRSSQTLRDRMADCDTELGKDREYNRLLRLGLDPNNSLAESLSYFKQAARQRNTSEVKNYIRQTEQALQDLEVTPAPASSSNASRTSYIDRYAGDMVWVEGGSFMMGSNEGDSNEKPVHRVNLDGFWMGKYEVTNEQFCVFLNEKGNQTEGGTTWLDIESSACDITQSGSRFLPKSGKSNYPVREVSWYGAKAYAAWMATKTGHSYHLPTEAQWEYAARGGQSARNTTYAGSNMVDEVGWFSSNSNLAPHPVGQKAANELGLYDMSGNLWEWCADWFDSDYYVSSPSSNPTGPSSGTGRVFRGGSWFFYPQSLRVARRGGNSPDRRADDIGFRLSRTL